MSPSGKSPGDTVEHEPKNLKESHKSFGGRDHRFKTNIRFVGPIKNEKLNHVGKWRSLTNKTKRGWNKILKKCAKKGRGGVGYDWGGENGEGQQFEKAGYGNVVQIPE